MFHGLLWVTIQVYISKLRPDTDCHSPNVRIYIPVKEKKFEGWSLSGLRFSFARRMAFVTITRSTIKYWRLPGASCLIWNPATSKLPGDAQHEINLVFVVACRDQRHQPRPCPSQSPRQCATVLYAIKGWQALSSLGCDACDTVYEFISLDAVPEYIEEVYLKTEKLQVDQCLCNRK